MKFQVSLFAAIVSLAACVAAQGASDPNCLSACAPLSKTTSKCGFDLIHSEGKATDKQLLCMCKEKNLVADDHTCESCLNKIGDLSDAEYQNSLSLKATCDILTASGARSITHGGCGYLVQAVLVAVGAVVMT